MDDNDFDFCLLQAYRAGGKNAPSAQIDERVLHAAKLHALARQRRRYLIPFAAAAALALAIGMNPWLRGKIVPDADQHAVGVNDVNVLRADLMRLQPPAAPASTVSDYLLDSQFLTRSANDEDH